MDTSWNFYFNYVPYMLIYIDSIIDYYVIQNHFYDVIVKVVLRSYTKSYIYASMMG